MTGTGFAGGSAVLLKTCQTTREDIENASLLMWTGTMTESECKQRIIKHPIFAAPLLLLVSLSAACQAELLTRRFIVELETDEGTLKQNLSIKRSWQTLPENLSEIGNTDTYPGSVSPPDRKRHNLYSYGVKTTLTESISWQLLYATNLLVDFELILTTKTHQFAPILIHV